MSRVVVLVLQTSALEFVERLARDLPVWIADTPEHGPLRARAVSDARLTWFEVRQGEPLVDAGLRIVSSLDQHHDEHSQEIPYDTLWVVGIPYEPSHLQHIAEFGFTSCASAWEGFIAVKDAVSGA